MKLGEVFLTRKTELCQFTVDGRVHPVNKVQEAPGKLQVNLCLGSVDADGAQHFSSDGALMALGFGPIVITRVQAGLVKALEAARNQMLLGPDDWSEDQEAQAVQQITDALAQAQNFSVSALPILDLTDAADAQRFQFCLQVAIAPTGAECMMAGVVAQEVDADHDPAVPLTREQFIYIIDEARRRLAAA